MRVPKLFEIFVQRFQEGNIKAFNFLLTFRRGHWITGESYQRKYLQICPCTNGPDVSFKMWKLYLSLLTFSFFFIFCTLVALFPPIRDKIKYWLDEVLTRVGEDGWAFGMSCLCIDIYRYTLNILYLFSQVQSRVIRSQKLTFFDVCVLQHSYVLCGLNCQFQ